MIQYHKRRIRNLKYSKVSYKVYGKTVNLESWTYQQEYNNLFVAYFSGYDLLSFIDDFVVHQLNAAGDDDLKLHYTLFFEYFHFY